MKKLLLPLLTQPIVAVVILNWNGEKFLHQFLPSVLASTYPNLRVIVADNASTDQSVNFVRQTFPSVEVLESNENYGFAKGYNYFLQQVTADYYVLLNSDVEVEQNWIEPIIALMESDCTIAACQPKLLAFHNKSEFEYAGASGGWIDTLGYPFARGRLFNSVEKDEGQYDASIPIFWASGAAFFIRASCFHNLHGFDPYFFAHQEEIDLCWRLQLAGYKIYCCPQSVVYHVGGGTLPTGSFRKVFLNYRNSLIMLYKNFSWKQLWWKLPVRIMLDGLAGWKEFFSGNTTYLKAVYKAQLAFFIWALAKHKQSSHVYSALPTMYQGSIIWQYFAKKNKKFSEIVKLS